MEEAIGVFDVNIMRGMSFAVVPVRAVEPDAIVEDLNKIFSSTTEGPMAGMVQFVPEQAAEDHPRHIEAAGLPPGSAELGQAT